MKIKTGVLLFYFLFFQFSSKAQTNKNRFRVVYELTYQIDSTENTNLRTERMFLNTDELLSSYESETNYLKDSILKSNNHKHYLAFQNQNLNIKYIKIELLKN